MTETTENLLVADTDDLIELLASEDSRVAEAAFEELRRRIGDVKRRIYYVAIREKGLQSLAYLVELLGESKDPKYFRFIAQQLKSEHPSVRFFAHAALLRLGTPQSKELHFRCNLRSLLSDALRNSQKADQQS